MTTTLRKWFLLAAAALLLASCSADPADEGRNAGAAASEKSAEAAAEHAEQSELDEPSDTAEDHAEPPADVLPEDRQPLAAIPERDIALYPVQTAPDAEEGVLLEIGEQRQTFDWRYTTPRQIMPRMHAADYDGDGQDELAVMLNIGSGTGVAVDELHMIEFHDVNSQSGEPFIDYLFAADNYTAQLKEALTFRAFKRDGGSFGEVTVSGRTYEVELDDYLAAYEVDAGAVEDTLAFGDIIYFEADAGVVTMTAAVGLVIDGYVQPQYIGSVDAVVAYEAGTFTLRDFRFTKELE